MSSELSRVVFGSEYRLPFLYTVAKADEEDLYPKVIGERCGIGARASTELTRLEKVGLLAKREPSPGSRRVVYERRDRRFWEFVVALVERGEA
jgi:hypothetical protein